MFHIQNPFECIVVHVTLAREEDDGKRRGPDGKKVCPRVPPIVVEICVRQGSLFLAVVGAAGFLGAGADDRAALLPLAPGAALVAMG